MLNIRGWLARLMYILHWYAYGCEDIRRIGVSETVCMRPAVERRKPLE